MYNIVNTSYPRIDGREKVTGRVKFGGDLNFYHQLYAKTLYSRYPHARIIAINTDRARELPGVAAIITARDIPGQNEMWGKFPVLAEEEVKYIGDGVAVVAAESPAIAEAAVKLIEVTYQELPGLVTLEAAMAEDAPLVHPGLEGNLIPNSYHRLRSGDVEKGFTAAEVVIERTYRTHFVDQAYIEPEVVIALTDPYREGIEIHGSFQNSYAIPENIGEALGLKISQVKVIQATIGGSFGGKAESMMVMAARAAVLARKTGRPVKMVLTREESLLESCKRHPFLAHYKIGARKDGTITAIQDEVAVQGGAYNNKEEFLSWRGSIHAGGPYAIPNIKTDIRGFFTHTIYGGAFRGFSAPQLVFCHESLIDELAEELGISPREIRLKNCLKIGDTMPSGQELTEDWIPAPLKELIEMTCGRAEYDRKVEEFKLSNRGPSPIKQGIGMAITFRGAGQGGEGIDTASAVLTINKDGSVNLQSGLVEMGQGMRTAHCQIAAETLGISMERITFSNTDTLVTMDSGATVASRGTFAGGQPVSMAARELKKRLHAVAADLLACEPADLISEDDVIRSKAESNLRISFEETVRIALKERGLSLSAQGWFNPGPVDLSPETGRGNAYPTYCYGCAVAEITVDTETGKINTKKITATYDVGTAINPQLVKGQLHGGLLQGMGFGLIEEFSEKDGYLKTLNFDDYLIPGAMDTPKLDVELLQTDDDIGPYGAKGAGELGVELVAPAIANALYQATGQRIRETPLNLERVLLGRALQK
ncbi:MAG: xanthine dehydrogenase family protein molybdopterin-binding subunit [Candidatus Auribacterota bacterium]|nr:xanthine dehydrogenase family protein molybdopterin-binding subunit [Candidatus Auribacterota bacterium]